MPKVSVVIPFYNVENYFEICLNRLFNQTLDDIEYIFVDDGSTNNSKEILNKIIKTYPNRRNRIKIIIHDINMGVAFARTSGIKNATGEYIIHCDADDYPETTMYETLYKKAKKEDADIVICNHSRLCKAKKIYDSNLVEFNNPHDYLIKWCELDCNYAPLWDKLIKRSLIVENGIYPVPNLDLGEDLICVVKAFYHAKKIIIHPDHLYNYNYRENSLTSSKLSDKKASMKIDLANQIKEALPEEKFDVLCNYFKFNTKMGLRNYFKDNPRYWFNLFSESHKDIFRFKSNSLKVRIFWFIILSHYPVFRCVQKYIKCLI